MSIFVFGSNTGGRHGKGAALTAYKNHGAQYGMGYGHYGDSFAIPTMDHNLKPLELEHIQCYVTGFLAYAYGLPWYRFKTTRIGCGLAGFKDYQIAPLFTGAPENVTFDEAWRPCLGHNHTYWGSFP